MTMAILVPFYLGIGAYCLAAGLSQAYVRMSDPHLLTLGKRSAAAGNTLLLVVFAARWMEYQLVPFTSVGDVLNLFLILCTGIMLTVQRDEEMKPLLSFYLPALAILALVNGVVGAASLTQAPKALNGILVTVHVGLVFLALSLFLVASLTSMVYALQAGQLKRHKPTPFFLRLPSLEQLDRLLFRLIAVGYPIFIVTFVFGFFWAYFGDPEARGTFWYLSPRIVFAFITLVFFGLAFYVRRRGILRGAKFAYMMFFGFTSLLIILVLLESLQYGGYSFWETQT